MSDPNPFTLLLERADHGDAAAAAELFPLVYGELRRIAAAQLSREAPGQTLQPTALVHEAWMRLASSDGQAWKSRSHFVAAAAESMRRVLVDAARRKLRVKRGAGAERVDLVESQVPEPLADQRILEVNDALGVLQREAPELAEVVMLRFFAGLNHHEVGALLGLNEKTIRRRWELARLRLHALIESSSA